jgi:hypothetical protein
MPNPAASHADVDEFITLTQAFHNAVASGDYQAANQALISRSAWITQHADMVVHIPQVLLNREAQVVEQLKNAMEAVQQKLQHLKRAKAQARQYKTLPVSRRLSRGYA